MPAHQAAVVVGGLLNGLSVGRSLAKGDVPVYVLDHRRLDAAMWSRYAHPVRTKPLHGPNLLDALRSLSKQLCDRPVLIITDEMAVLTISEFRSELDGLFRFHLPAHETVLMLQDKARFHEFAVGHGLPVPQGEVLRDPTDIERIRALRFPVIIKPADKKYFHLEGAPRLIIANDYKTAGSNSRKLLTIVGEIIVQECIPGPDSNIYFSLFYRRGNDTIQFLGQKLASNPPGSGSTALCVQVEDRKIGKLLERTTHDFVGLVGYEGFGSVEYKLDPVSGRFLIIEPTVGRTDWQEEIATLCGANIPLAGYCVECGLPLPPTDRAATNTIVWQGSFIDRIRVGSRTIPPKARVIDGYWRWDDPLPALVHYPLVIASIITDLSRRYRFSHIHRAMVKTIASAATLILPLIMSSGSEASPDFVLISGAMFTLAGKPFFITGVNNHYLTFGTEGEVLRVLDDSVALGGLSEP
jgi:D-aspartate ligase